MRCPACGDENPDGKRFCENCGAPLALVCPACGWELTPGKRFCGNCGGPTGNPIVREDAVSEGPVSEEPRGTELRQVSVLFCDLVSYTPLAESREPEEVREFLSGYFDRSQAIVSQHGGVVEKFIGDAVMAVWGAPVATEDDAERAVRAGLELVSAIPAYGRELAIELQARVGVATGRVATSEGVGKGLVIGDRVNTAARIQAAAPPGRCYVDAATRRLAGTAISFEEAGVRSLKGKAEPEEIFGAVRVLSGVGGRRHASGLEGPLIGREMALRTLKDLFHSCVERKNPRLVVVSGLPGVGKSRLSWELEKHLDGLVGTVLWHVGRCLSYGDGIAFWALAEIVRGRLGIAEDEQADAAAAKFADDLARLVPEPQRDYVGACLSGLLGVDYPSGKPGLRREQLFAGWRTFFECLARSAPVVLVIEDAENADDDLLDFLDHLVDWARGSAVYVLVLARPELSERRPGFGSGRNRTALYLEPLAPEAMNRLVGALVPALPGGALEALTARAGGIPLFALETIRSLLDAGTLVRADEGYRLTGKLGDFSVPESLHGLLAARLDAFDLRVRRLVGIAAVLGTTFSGAALVALSGRPAHDVNEGLADLVFRDVLVPDVVSLERTSYRFAHQLLREVAYETLSKRERKSRHLAVAAYLRATFANDGEEVAEIVSRHYLDALAAGPGDADAPSIGEEGFGMLVRAAERAERTGAPGRAAANYAAAAELVTARHPDPDARQQVLRAAALWERAAGADRLNSDFENTIAHAEAARRCYLDLGDARGAARARTLAGRALSVGGRIPEARVLLADALAVLQPSPDVDTVAALDALAEVELLDGAPEAGRLSAEALDMAQALDADPGLVAGLFITRGITHVRANRMAEAAACYTEAARLSERAGRTAQRGWALANLSDALGGFDSAGAAEAARAAAEHARQVGARRLLGLSTLNLTMALLELGEWDDADAVLATALQHDELGDNKPVRFAGGLLAGLRGDAERAYAAVAALADWRSSQNPQEQAWLATLEAFASAAVGQPSDALAYARKILGDAAATLGIRHETVRWAWPLAARSARSLSDNATAAELVALLDGHPDDELPRILRAERDLARAAARDTAGELGTPQAFADAIAALRAAASPFHLAHGLLDRADYFAGNGDAASANAAAVEAKAIGARLSCPPLVLRASALAGELGRIP
jgi:class 3 adenylate cyclase